MLWWLVAGRAALAGTFLFICVQEAIAVLAGAGRPSTGGLAPLPALRAFFEKSSQRLWFAPPASGVAGCVPLEAERDAQTLLSSVHVVACIVAALTPDAIKCTWGLHEVHATTSPPPGRFDCGYSMVITPEPLAVYVAI